jgi:hypothetical protein
VIVSVVACEFQFHAASIIQSTSTSLVEFNSEVDKAKAPLI